MEDLYFNDLSGRYSNDEETSKEAGSLDAANKDPLEHFKNESCDLHDRAYRTSNNNEDALPPGNEYKGCSIDRVDSFQPNIRNERNLTKNDSAVPTHGTTEKEDDYVDENDDTNTNNADSEWIEMEGREWVQVPFELVCVDAVLRVVCDMLTEDTIELEREAKRCIDQVLSERGVYKNDDPLVIIRVIKDALQLMTARIKGFVQSIHRTLDEDEDMALMNLSRLLTHPERFIQPVTQEILEVESDEPELILESNLQVGLTLLNYLDLIQGQVQSTKDLLDQKQDQVRNRLLFANLTLNVLMLCITVMSVVSGFFGMNVPNGREEDPSMFHEIIFSSLAGAIALCILIMAGLICSGTLLRSSGGSGTAMDISD
jgi:magnesium transporter